MSTPISAGDFTSERDIISEMQHKRVLVSWSFSLISERSVIRPKLSGFYTKTPKN
jgi:hypothetical protein